MRESIDFSSSSPRLVNILHHARVAKEARKCPMCHPHKGMDVFNKSIVRRNWKQYRRKQWKTVEPTMRVTEIDIELLFDDFCD